MPRYDYRCPKCESTFEVEKKMMDPDPEKCLLCGRSGIVKLISAPNVTYPNRPPWTYKEAKKYKTARWNNGPLTKIDPSKHGDLASWNCPGEVLPEPKKKKRKTKGK